MVFPLYVSDVEMDPGKNSGARRRSPRHHGIQSNRDALVHCSIHRSRSGESAAAFDHERHRRVRAAVHRGDDDCWVCDEMMAIQKNRSHMTYWTYASYVIITVVLCASTASAQKKSSCIE